MTLAALLTFIGLLLASYSAVRLPYRRLIRVIVPPLIVIGPLAMSFLLLSWPPLNDAFGSPLHRLGVLVIHVVAFILPLTGLGYATYLFHGGVIQPNRLRLLQEAWRAARETGEFEGIRWSLERNLSSLHAKASPSTLQEFFSEKFVERMVEQGSWLHLEMLADSRVIGVLPDRFAAADTLIRCLLRSRRAILHKWVNMTHGGHEGLSLEDHERELIKRTFGCPEWYMSMAARYPLVMFAVERLASGELDWEYNGDADLYTFSQGVSRRSYCPVWVASKAMHLAIREAIRRDEKGDMYVSTLWDILRAVVERSEYPTKHWTTQHSGLDYPTPYAFLVHEICRDLQDLAREASKGALRRTPAIEEAKEVPQLSIVLGIWAGCIAFTSLSNRHVSHPLAVKLVRDYLDAMLQIGFSPQDLIFERPRGVPDVVFERYRDLFWEELRREFGGVLRQRTWSILLEAAAELDRGKSWVRAGREWLDGALGVDAA